MSEHKLYLEDKVAWTMMLMHKYLPVAQFDETMQAVVREATQAQRNGANQAWADYKDVQSP